MFSIIIPLYNKSHTIISTITSVLAQAFEDFEVIIVNDGSTDNSVEIVQDFTDDSRVKIINQNNQGVSVARNRGVDEAKYNYIAFLDGDDEWMPKYLETIKQAIEKYPEAGMICCAGIYRDVKTNYTCNRLVEKYKNQIRLINYFENPHVFTQTSAITVTKESFYKANGFPVGMKKNEDFALFFSIALISPTVYCGFPLSCYNGNVDGQATASNQNETLKTESDVCQRMNITYQIWNRNGRKDKLFKTFLKYELRHAIVNALRGKKFNLIDLYIDKLDNGIINCFSKIEIQLYQIPLLRKVNILLILIAKLIWRLNGFPRVKS